MDGYRQYGRRFIENFIRHWPNDVTLYVYHEGSDIIESNRVKPINLLKALPNCVDFINRWKNDHEACGREPNSPTRWRGKDVQKGYNFRFDVVKFCRKVFVIEHAAWQIESGKMFWVDADTVTFADIPLSLLDRMLPEGADTSYLGREGSHSECGFIGYNLDQPLSLSLITLLSVTYAGEAVFAMAEWHDSYVYDRCRERLEKSNDMVGHCIPSPKRGHVFIHSELGRYMDHLKGDRKAYGRSTGENTMPHDIPYWNGGR